MKCHKCCLAGPFPLKTGRSGLLNPTGNGTPSIHLRYGFPLVKKQPPDSFISRLTSALASAFERQLCSSENLGFLAASLFPFRWTSSSTNSFYGDRLAFCLWGIFGFTFLGSPYGFFPLSRSSISCSRSGFSPSLLFFGVIFSCSFLSISLTRSCIILIMAKSWPI